MTAMLTSMRKRALLLCTWGALFSFLVGSGAVLYAMKESSDPLTAQERTWVAAHPVIRLAPDPDFAPVEYLDENGAYRGITRDYLAVLQKKLGIRIDIVRLRNWDEIISKAKKREIDVYVASKTPQRAEYMLFTKPFLQFPLVIIARDTTEKPKQSLTLDQLNGMTVSVVSQYAAEELIRASHPALRLDPVPDVKTGLRKVSFGVTDVFVESLPAATFFMEKEGIGNLRIAGESGYVYRLGFCSRKDWPELNRILEKGIAAIDADEKKAIFKRWIPFGSSSVLFDRAFQIRLLMVVGGVLVLFSWIIAWNRELAKQVRVRTAELERELAERRRAEEELRQARGELERKVAQRTAALREANESLEREISVRTRAEEVSMARLRLLHFADEHTLDEVLEATLDEAETLTGSRIGFYHFLEDDQETISLQNWSTRTKAEFCTAEGKGRHYNVSTAGVWLDCIRERRAVIHNDYASLAHRKGLPPGHAPVVRELVVPVMRGDKIVAVLGVGNKETDYAGEDVDVVSLLADLAWEITERKRMEEALLFSQFCIDKACVGIFETNEQGTIFGVNEYACQSLGYSQSELAALTVFDLDPEITPAKMLEIRKVLEEAGHVTFETSHRHKSGRVFPVEITANLMEFHGKEYGICFVKDISVRKEAEEALKESQARLKMAMDLAGLVQWEYDVPSRTFTLDDQFYALYGTSAEREGGGLMSAGEYARRFIPADESHLVAGGVEEVLAKHSNQLEHRIIRADGEERVVLVRGEAIRDDAGRVVKIRGANQDITERKRIEEALRESRAKYQVIVDSFDGLIYVSSKDMRIQFMNRKLKERTGYDAVGEPCYKVMHDREQVCPWCVSDRVFEGESIHWDMYSPKDRCWYDVLNVPIRHADGSMSKHSMMIDITDRKLAEQELKRQQRLLRELNETLEKRVAEEVAKNREKDIMLIQQNRQAALGEMLDHIAHQWKQPLNSIAILLALLEETSANDVEDTVEKINAIVQHMAQTVDVFRGFYRPDKEKTFFRVKDSIDQALAFIGPAYRFGCVVVEVDVDAGLMAYGYPKEYTQVLLNVLVNARDVFRSRQTPKPRVEVRGFADDGRTVVTVADNAGGIPEQIMEHIFDFYFTTNESGSGTGIGLYMSKNIIEKNMGGAIGAGNTELGALFRIEVPSR